MSTSNATSNYFSLYICLSFLHILVFHLVRSFRYPISAQRTAQSLPKIFTSFNLSKNLSTSQTVEIQYDLIVIKFILRLSNTHWYFQSRPKVCHVTFQLSGEFIHFIHWSKWFSMYLGIYFYSYAIGFLQFLWNVQPLKKMFIPLVIRPIEIGLLWAKINYRKSHSKALDFGL